MGRLRVGLVVGGCLLALLAPSGASGAVDRCRGQEQIVAASNIAGSERALLCLVNAYRADHGRAVLPHNPILRQIARAHSEDMVVRHFYDHTNPDGQGPTERANAAGYPEGVGENIFTIREFFKPTVASFFRGWIESPGHRANIVRPDYRAAGMGFAPGHVEAGEAGATGTQTFGFQAQGATDTAVDLFVSAECTEAKRDKKRAKRRIRGAKKQLRRADSRRQRVKAKRKLRKARKVRRRAKRQIARHCNPSRY